jgi:hypothetical protein
MYLQQLNIEHFDLILKYSSWVFEKDPEQGMQVIQYTDLTTKGQRGFFIGGLCLLLLSYRFSLTT